MASDDGTTTQDERRTARQSGRRAARAGESRDVAIASFARAYSKPGLQRLFALEYDNSVRSPSECGGKSPREIANLAWDAVDKMAVLARQFEAMPAKDCHEARSLFDAMVSLANEATKQAEIASRAYIEARARMEHPLIPDGREAARMAKIIVYRVDLVAKHGTSEARRMISINAFLEIAAHALVGGPIAVDVVMSSVRSLTEGGEITAQECREAAEAFR
jgi:hypothetical protein